MKARTLALVAALLATVAPGARAQTVSQGYWVTPKAGHAAQLQSALADHAEWRKDHEDAWAWTVFEVVQGSNIGDWYITSFGHTWGDLDSYQSPEGAAEHWQATVAPHVEQFRSNLLVTDDLLTRAPQQPGAMLFHITTWNIAPAMQGAFNQSVARMLEAYDRAQVPYDRFFWSMVIGPDDQQKVRSRPYRNWAEMADAPNPAAVMLQVFGENETTKILDQYRSAVISTRDYVLELHPEMSVPAAM
jgi:hypothetical protein